MIKTPVITPKSLPVPTVVSEYFTSTTSTVAMKSLTALSKSSKVCVYRVRENNLIFMLLTPFL